MPLARTRAASGATGPRTRTLTWPAACLLAAVKRHIIGATAAVLALACSALELGCLRRSSRQPSATAAQPLPSPPGTSPDTWLQDARTKSSEERAAELVAALTQDEKLSLLTGYFGVQKDWNQVLMPWLDRVSGALEAWYPGSRGGPAIARVLERDRQSLGASASGFPRTLEQLPRATIPGAGLTKGEPFHVRYDEGAAVGYRWYDKKGFQPLFAFGHGLSYSTLQPRSARCQPCQSVDRRELQSAEYRHPHGKRRGAARARRAATARDVGMPGNTGFASPRAITR